MSDLVFRLSRWFDDIFDEKITGAGFLPKYEENWFSMCEGNFPSYDLMLKEDKSLQLQLAVAGYNKSNVEIEFDGDYLVISGKHLDMNKSSNDKYLTRGIRTRAWATRSFVPQGRYDSHKAKASFADGVLTVTIPAKEKKDRNILNIE